MISVSSLVETKNIAKAQARKWWQNPNRTISQDV